MKEQKISTKESSQHERITHKKDFKYLAEKETKEKLLWRAAIRSAVCGPKYSQGGSDAAPTHDLLCNTSCLIVRKRRSVYGQPPWLIQVILVLRSGVGPIALQWTSFWPKEPASCAGNAGNLGMSNIAFSWRLFETRLLSFVTVVCVYCNVWASGRFYVEGRWGLGKG